MNLWKTFEELNKLYESKQDIDKFIAKFGLNTYDLFKKSTQRLKNNNISTDLVWHTKHTEPKELENILYNLQNRIKTKDGNVASEIAGNYKLIGEKNGFKIYEVLDHIAAMNLGVGTGWCISGRYQHYGEPNYKPAEEEAKKHWNEYTRQGVKFFFFLSPKEKYAIAIYPETFSSGVVVQEYNKVINKCNFELFNAEDEKQNKDIYKLPIEVLKDQLILDDTDCIDGLFIFRNWVLKAKPDVTSVTIPSGITRIDSFAFDECEQLKQLSIPKSVVEIGKFAFSSCKMLTNIQYEGSLLEWSNIKKENCLFSKDQPLIIFKGGEDLGPLDTEAVDTCAICGWDHIYLDTGKSIGLCYFCAEEITTQNKIKDAPFLYILKTKKTQENNSKHIEGYAESKEQAISKIQSYKKKFKDKELEVELLDSLSGEIIEI